MRLLYKCVQYVAGADPGYVKRGEGEIQMRGRVADITQK